MLRKTNFVLMLLLLSYSSAHPQDPQAGRPAQPTPSVYNRMKRISGTEAQQARQFPNPAQQFPPDQHSGTGPMQAYPAPQPGSQPVTPAQNGRIYVGGPSPVSNAQPQQQPAQALTNSQQAPYGLALQPPNPPNIRYANGELTIVANNSSLAEIVGGIERATGARLEGTRPDAERVFGQFGPGSTRDVLNSLFDGSRYDFILVGSLENPTDVQTIILSPHGTAPAAGANAANASPPPQAERNEEQEDNEPTIQGSEMGRPAQNVPSEQVAPPQPPAGQPQQQQVKTPEQLLQELQRLRQQQQQQSQQSQTPR